MYWAFRCGQKCGKYFSKSHSYLDKFSDYICCLCVRNRFYFYEYSILMALFGAILSITDIFRDVTNGPIRDCKARLDYQQNKWFLCPRLERDICLMGSFLNLLLYLMLLIGLIAIKPSLVLPWLMYKVFLVSALLVVFLARLLILQVCLTRGELITLVFTIFNIIQVSCAYFGLVEAVEERNL